MTHEPYIDKPCDWDFTGIETDRSAADDVLENARKRAKRQPKNGEKRRTPQASKVRERGGGHVQDPWNRDVPMKLYVCDSVRQLLPAWSDYR